jgi:hypothetical protein
MQINNFQASTHFMLQRLLFKEHTSEATNEQGFKLLKEQATHSKH